MNTHSTFDLSQQENGQPILVPRGEKSPLHMHTTSHAHHITCTPHHMHTTSHAHHITCTPHHMYTTSHAHHITCTPHHMHTTSHAHQVLQLDWFSFTFLCWIDSLRCIPGMPYQKSVYLVTGIPLPSSSCPHVNKCYTLTYKGKHARGNDRQTSNSSVGSHR